MSFLKYNERDAIRELRKEAREKGRAEGRTEGEERVLELVAQGLTYEEIKKKIEKPDKKSRS